MQLKNWCERIKKQERGITLIALVVTIVVLLFQRVPGSPVNALPHTFESSSTGSTLR